MNSWLVRGVRIVDPAQESSPILDIRIIDGMIAEVGKALEPDPGVPILDASGLTATPSLIDIHVHTGRKNDLVAYARGGIRHIRYAGVDLQTVRDARTLMSHTPTMPLGISSCGPMLDTVEPAYPEWTHVVAAASDAAIAARAIITTGEVEALIVTQGMRGDAIAAIAREAHAAGLPVVGQIWAADGIEAALAGIDQLDNSSRVFASKTVSDDEMLSYRSVAERLATWARAWTDVDWSATERIQDTMVDHNVVYCPTLVAHEFQAGGGEEIVRRDTRWDTSFDASDISAYRAFRAYIEADWPAGTHSDLVKAMDSRMEWIRRFRSRGGRIVVGTDMPFGGLTIVRELELLIDAGMSNKEVILAATQDAADALGPAGFVARIVVGADASFMLTAGEPEHDIAILRRPSTVFLKGCEL